MNQQTFNRGLKLGLEATSLFMLKILLEDITQKVESKQKEFNKFCEVNKLK